MITQNDSIVHPQMRRFALFVAILVGIIKCLEVLTPMAHGDALYYHLPLAKFWLESGFMNMHRELAGSLQAGLFDYLYLIPIGIFGSTICGQLAAQAFYYLCSIGLATWIIVKALNPNLLLKLFIFIYMISYSVDSDFFIFAKNDGVLASMGLLATLEFTQRFVSKNMSSRSEILIKGFLLGLLPLIKINGLIICVVLGLYYLGRERKLIPLLKITFLSILVALPLFIRNYYFIGSPFYPGLLSLFPGQLTPPMMAFYKASMQNPMTMESIFFHLKAFIAFKVINVFILVFFLWKRRFALSSEIKISLSIFLVYLILNGGVPAARFYFICFFLNSYFILHFLEKINWSNKSVFLVLILLLVDSKLDKSIGRIKKSLIAINESHNSREFINKTIMQTTLWNYVPEENQKIITDDFLEVFYAPKGTRMYHYKQMPEAFHLYRCSNEFKDIEKLNEYDYAFLNLQYGIRNECTAYIRQNFKLLFKDHMNEVYKRVIE